MAYSIIQTTKANGLDAYAYLCYLFEQLPNQPFQTNPDLLNDYLPWSTKLQKIIKQC
ncbi:MAG: transposase domain-containing protein [Lactococcus chungangensis]|uniref:Transposase domain-containing protein n=1 Tax=Pseudolactococcus chungangensis TaxID=451457 RepID=A0A847J4S7_9LACT|nr:transposase domain-containing protein [Lactococcus chungangensis]